MRPVINALLLRAADDMDTCLIQIDEGEVFRVIAGCTAGKSLMVHWDAVPFEICIVFHLLHGRGKCFLVPIIGANDLERLYVRETGTFPVQYKAAVLQGIGIEDPCWCLILYGQYLQPPSRKGTPQELFLYQDIQSIVPHQAIYKSSDRNLCLAVCIYGFQDQKFPRAQQAVNATAQCFCQDRKDCRLWQAPSRFP